MQAFLEVRCQHAKGSFPRQGPDTYVAVQVVPSNATRLVVLNRSVAAKRGIKIIYCGEGYATRQQTDRSMLGSALLEGRRIAKIINDNADLLQLIID